MTLIVSTILFVILIVIISALRRRMVFELQGSGLLLFRSERAGIVLYSILTLPGTILHELSHFLVAEILQVRTGEITIIPSFDDSGSVREERLGSVATADSGLIRGFLIGIAPFVTGIGSLIVMGYYLEIGWSAYPWWVIALLIYGLIVVGNSMLISRSDRKTWPVIAIFLLLIVTASYWSGLRLAPQTLDTINSVISRINMALGVTLGLNLAMIVGLYVLRRSIEKITKRRVVTRRNVC